MSRTLPERTLIAEAAEAAELFREDVLEEYAAELRRMADQEEAALRLAAEREAGYGEHLFTRRGRRRS